MSTSVDNRVVQMQFDNAQFESGIAQSMATLEKLDKALDSLESTGGFAGLSKSISSVGDQMEEAFSFRGIAALTAFQSVAQDVINFIKDGFQGLVKNYLPVDLLGQAMSGGMSRASNIEQAKFRLEGLGVAWEDLAADIDYAVNQTAYGLDAAGKAASQLAASGVQFGEEFGATGNSPMAKALRGISGVAAMTSSSYDEIAHIFTTIAGNGKMMTKELRMMSYRGLNVAATMCDQFNQVLAATRGELEDNDAVLEKYSDDVVAQIIKMNNGAAVNEEFLRDHMKDGIVSSELFFEAMNAAYGEHATKANDTYAGSLDNVKAALSRLGAVYYTGHMDNMIPFFNSLRIAINDTKTALTPMIEGFVEFEKQAVNIVSNIFAKKDKNGNFVSSIFGDSVKNVVKQIRAVLDEVRLAGRVVFGAFDPQKIYNKLYSFFDFFKRIQISFNTLTDLRLILEGVFSAFDLFGKAVRTAMYVLEPFGNLILNTVGVALRLFLDTLASIGTEILKFNTSIESNEKLKAFVDTLRDFTENVAGKLQNALVYIIAAIKTFFDVIVLLVDNIDVVANALGIDLVGALNNVKIILLTIGQAIAFIGAVALMALVGAVLQVIEWITNLYNTIKNFSWEEFRKGIDDTIKSVGEFLDELIAKAPEGLQGFLKDIKHFGGDMVRNVVGFIDKVVARIDRFIYIWDKYGFKAAVGDLLTFLKRKLGEVAAPFVAAFYKITSTIENAYNTIKYYVDRIKEAFAEGGLGGVYKLFENKAASMAQSLGSIITAVAPGAVSAITTAFGAAWDAIGGFFDSIGDTRLGGFVNSIRDGFGTVIDTISGLFETFRNSDFVTGFVDDIQSGLERLSAEFKSGGLSGVLSWLGDELTAKLSSALGSGEAILQAITETVKTLIGVIKELALAVGDFIVKAFQGNFSGALDTMSAGLTNITDLFEQLYNSIVQFDPTSLLARIATAIHDFFGIFKKEDTEAVTRGMPGIGNTGPVARKKTYGTGNGKAKKGEASGFGPVGVGDWLKQAEKSGQKTEEELGKAEGILGGIIAGVQNAAQGISDLLGDEDFGQKLKTALGLTVLIAIPQIIIGIWTAIHGLKNAATGVANAGKGLIASIKGMVNSISSFLTGMVGAVKTFALLGGLTKMIGAITAFVAVFAASFYFIGKMNDNEIKQAKNVMYTILGVIGGCILVITLMAVLAEKTNKSSSVLEASKKGVNTFVKSVALFLGLIAAVSLLAIAFKLLTTIKWDDNVVKSFVALLGIIAVLAVCVATMSMYAPVLSKGAITLLAMAVAVDMLVGTLIKMAIAVAIFEHFGKGDAIGSAVGLLLSVMAVFSGLALAASKMGFGGGVGLLAAALSIHVMIGAILKIINSADMIEGLGAPSAIGNLVTVALAIGTLIVTLTIVSKLVGDSVAKLGIGILALSLAVGMLAGTLSAIALVSKLFSGDEVKKAIWLMITAVAAVGVLLVATKNAGKLAASTVFGLMALSGVVAMLTSVGLAIAALSKYVRWQDCVKAIAFMIVVFAGLGHLIGNLVFTEKAKLGPLLGVIGILISAGFMLKMLADIPWQDMIAPTAAISAVFLAIGAMFKLGEKLSWASFGSILVAVAAVVAIAWSLRDLMQVTAPVTRGMGGGDGSSGGLGKAVLAIAAVIGAMAVLTQASEGANWASLASLVAMVYLVQNIATSLVYLVGYDWTQIAASAGGIAGVAIALAGTAKIMEGVDAKGFFGLLEIAAVVGIVGYTLYQIAQFDWTQIAVAAAGIAGVALALAGTAAIMAAVNVMGMIGLAVIAGVIAIAGYELAKLAEYDWTQIAAAAAGLAGAILAISVAGVIGTAGIVGLVGIALVIGVVAAAFLALAFAAPQIAAGVDQIVESFKGLVEFFENGTALGGLVSGIANELTELVTGGENGEGLSGLPAKVAEIAADIGPKFKEGWEAGKELLSDIGSGLADLIFGKEGEEGGGLAGIATKALEAGKGILTKLNEGMHDEGTLSLITTGLDTLKTSIIGAPGGEGGGGTGLFAWYNDTVSAGKNFLQGFIDGTQDQSLWGMAKSGLVGFATWCANGFTSEGLQEHSPSLLTWIAGLNFLLGFNNGIVDNQFIADAAIIGAGQNAIQTLDSTVNDGSAQEIGRQLPAELASGIESGAPEVEGASQSLLEMIIGALTGAGGELEAAGSEAGEVTFMGLINSLGDQSLLTSLSQAAELMGFETTSALLASISEGGVDVEAVCGALGVDMTSELGQKIQLGMQMVQAIAAGNIQELGALFEQAGGVFNLDGEEGVPGPFQELWQKLKDIGKGFQSVGAGGGGGGGGGGKGGGSSAKSDKEAAEAAKTHAKAVEYQNKVIEEFNRVYGVAYQHLGETAAIDAAKEAIREMAIEYAKAGDDIEVSEEEIEKAFVEMYDNIYKAIDGSIDMFSKFKVESEGSTRDFINNMKSNLDAADEWANGLERLAARGFSKGLIEALSNEGVKSLGKVRMLLKSSVDDMIEANALWDQKDEATSNAAIKALTAMAYAGKTTAAVLAMASGDIGAAVSDIPAEIVNAYNEWTADKLAIKNLGLIDEMSGELKEEITGVFGNIDLNNRQVLTWTEDTLDQFKDSIGDWVEDVESLPGTISTVLGSSSEYDGVEIAFSPMLQTEAGPEVLSQATVDKYIFGLIEEAGDNWSSEDLLRLDTKGLEIDGKHINNILADVGETAKTTGEAMHYLGKDGSIARNFDLITTAVEKSGKSFEEYTTEIRKASEAGSAAAKKMQMEIAARVDQINTTYRELKTSIADVISEQMDLFTKFERKTEISGSEMLENMASQVDAVMDWAQGITQLYARGFDEGLVQQIRELGPKGYETLNAFLDMSEDQIDQANQYYQQSLTAPTDAAAIVSENYLSIATNGLNQMITSMQANQPQIDAQAQAMITGAATAAKTQATVEAPGVATGFVTELKNNLESNSSIAEAGGETVATNTATATDTKIQGGMSTAGYNADVGLANSVMENSGIVADAGSSLGNVLLNSFYETVGQGSPWKTMIDSGRFANMGLAQGLDEYSNISITAANETGSSILDSFNNAVADFSTILGDDVDLDPTIRPTLDLDDLEAKSKILSSMFDSRSVEVAGNITNVGSSNKRLLNAINNLRPGDANNMSVGGITINTQPGQDPQEIANAVSSEIYRRIRSREAVMA